MTVVQHGTRLTRLTTRTAPDSSARTRTHTPLGWFADKMVELSLSSCPCCLPATLLGAVVLSWILLQCLGGLLTAPAAKGSPPGLLSRTISILSKMFGVLLIFFAIFLGVLETNDDLRKWGFSILCSKMTQGSDLDVLRCGENFSKLGFTVFIT